MIKFNFAHKHTHRLETVVILGLNKWDTCYWRKDDMSLNKRKLNFVIVRRCTNCERSERANSRFFFG